MGTGHQGMTLIAATGNRGKLVEIREILGPHFDRILSQKEAGILLDVEEDTDTFAGNAMKKARAFCEVTGMPAVADDSGLCVDALNGEPGVYSARYMGEGHTDAERSAFVLEKMKDVPEDRRSARFMCAAVIAFPDGT
ncbi:MAG: non-canonical purine NTP pyrophosphatase, partial [Clostridia bacterium]|nr:non-canonical purine NTP pyrophosphatase [Clostridia bacterium]